MRTFKTFDYIFITGVTGCGKSTLLQEILDTCGDVELLQKYTTRPMRDNEKSIQKKRMEYQFINEDDVIHLKNMLELSIVNTYNTANGPYVYAFPKYNKPREDITYIQVLGAGDITSIMEQGEFPENSLLINITVNEKSVLEKLFARKDDDESLRRYNSDCLEYGIMRESREEDPFWTKVSEFFTKERKSNYVEVSNVMYFMTPKQIVFELKSMFTVPYMDLNHMRIIKHNPTGLPMLQTDVNKNHKHITTK